MFFCFCFPFRGEHVTAARLLVSVVANTVFPTLVLRPYSSFISNFQLMFDWESERCRNYNTC